MGRGKYNPNPPIDMTDKKINMLTVLHRAESVNGRTMWHCRCDCGRELDVWYAHLKKGQYSCGCATARRISEKMTRHGGSDSRLFGVWSKMKERCYRQNHKSYNDYGGRGIKVCDEWLDNYANFRDWAIQNGYNENAEFMKCTLDRIDSNGNYEPDNCRWVDMKVQCNNRRNNRYLEYRGEKHTVAEWSDLLNIPYDTIFRRLELGWTDGQALSFEFHRGVRVKPTFDSYDAYRNSVDSEVAL